MVKDYLAEFAQRKSTPGRAVGATEDDEEAIIEKPSYIDTERAESADSEPETGFNDGKLVDVVLSDMSAPWLPMSGFSSNTLSNPYRRMMNTSGMFFRDHAASMVGPRPDIETFEGNMELTPAVTQDLCLAALKFASDTLRAGGHFVCKFYQGNEDKKFESILKKMFRKVYREKPDSSRSESREAYFVATRRMGDAKLEDVI
jgi:21S rRNA (uridine2791-2'-O)-methyltransferase